MECVSDYERSMRPAQPGALGQSQLDFGRTYPDVPVASTSQQHSSSNLNYNHHDKRYANANAPISQNGNFQFSNSVQIASQNTLVSSNKKDGYESDRSMNNASGASRSSNPTSPLLHMTVSDFEKYRHDIIQKAYTEGIQKGREIGYAEASIAFQERLRSQDSVKRAAQRSAYEMKQRDATPGNPSTNNHEARRRSMTIDSMGPAGFSQARGNGMNSDAPKSAPNWSSAPNFWASSAQAEFLASIYQPSSYSYAPAMGTSAETAASTQIPNASQALHSLDHNSS